MLFRVEKWEAPEYSPAKTIWIKYFQCDSKEKLEEFVYNSYEWPGYYSRDRMEVGYTVEELHVIYV